MRIRITVKKSDNAYYPLDCAECGLVLRDLEDVLSQKKYEKCSECRTNHAKTSIKDN